MECQLARLVVRRRSERLKAGADLLVGARLGRLADAHAHRFLGGEDACGCDADVSIAGGERFHEGGAVEGPLAVTTCPTRESRKPLNPRPIFAVAGQNAADVGALKAAEVVEAGEKAIAIGDRAKLEGTRAFHATVAPAP